MICVEHLNSFSRFLNLNLINSELRFSLILTIPGQLDSNSDLYRIVSSVNFQRSNTDLHLQKPFSFEYGEFIYYI